MRSFSFRSIGIELIPLMLKSADKFINEDPHQRTGDVATYIMNSLRSFSDVRDISLDIVKHPHLLKTLTFAISMSSLKSETRISAIATLANLAFYVEEYRVTIAQQPGVLRALVEISLSITIKK